MSRKSVGLVGGILVFVVLIMLGGCATSQSNKQDKKDESAVQSPSVVPLEKPYGEILVYEIETTPVLKKDYEQDLKDCRTTLINSLLRRNKYKRVEAVEGSKSDSKPALLVRVQVSDMRIASFGARFWGGAFAGNSYMNIHMVLTDAETRKVVREADFNSSNNAFAATWTFGANDRSLPSDMAEIMADYIDKAVRAI